MREQLSRSRLNYIKNKMFLEKNILKLFLKKVCTLLCCFAINFPYNFTVIIIYHVIFPIYLIPYLRGN